MSLENASTGFTDFDELARGNTPVVARIRQIHPEERNGDYTSYPVTIDLLICGGPRAGEVVRGYKVKKNGITSTLRRSSEGKDVAGVIAITTSDKRKDPFVGMNPCDPAQLETVKAVYRDGVGFDSNENLVSAGATAAPGTSGNSAAAPATERPPF